MALSRSIRWATPSGLPNVLGSDTSGQTGLCRRAAPNPAAPSPCPSESRPSRPCSPWRLEWATIQSRFLSWGAPTHRADMQPQRASYPSSARSRRTRPSPREVSIGEFSTKTKRGPTSRTTRAISPHKPDLAPSSPAPAPAALMSWQGKPPHTMSTSPRQGFPSNCLTSAKMGNQGSTPSCWRACKTCWQ